MTKTPNVRAFMEHHPCFSNKAHSLYGRIHLPVASECNIRCRYCIRSVNATEDRPGVTEEILSPSKAVDKLGDLMAKDSAIKVVAVAGPGEPLANEETFEALNMAKEFFPGLIRCIATNGLLLSERAQRLEHLGVATVTVTVNAVDPAIGSHIYDYVRINGEAYYGQKAAEVLIDRQYQGVKEVISRGMAVKINTVLIPGINGDHMVEVARRYAGLDIHVMNITPLIPVGKFAEMRPPTHQELSVARRECGRYIKQFTKCKQCRADACGIPGGQDGLLARPCL